MLRFAVASIIAVSSSRATSEPIAPAVAIVHKDNEDIYYANSRKNRRLEDKYLRPADRSVPKNQYSDLSDVLYDTTNEDVDQVTFLPEPTSEINYDNHKPSGHWLNEQKLTVENFKETIEADVENVWVVAYIDPRCKDCYELSIEWEKLT